jgi:acylphosphatase
MTVVTRHLRIAGRVQGVGYRDALRAEAIAQGVSGWVRNRRDGSVEAVLQGSVAATEAVIGWARRGPPAARVSGVEVEDATGELARAYAGFDWLPTA